MTTIMFCKSSPAGASLLVGGSHDAAPLSIAFCAKFAGVHPERTSFESKERMFRPLAANQLAEPEEDGG
ncbi:hypothetical protein GCM10023156_12700 [Novipirellula rosea]|uniref:Uncharacterized protein n=1 Tax=Novipirellula rosea TaxID=1031540 RepID=A0ABP8MDT5_9BACT